MKFHSICGVSSVDVCVCMSMRAHKCDHSSAHFVWFMFVYVRVCVCVSCLPAYFQASVFIDLRGRVMRIERACVCICYVCQCVPASMCAHVCKVVACVALIGFLQANPTNLFCISFRAPNARVCAHIASRSAATRARTRFAITRGEKLFGHKKRVAYRGACPSTHALACVYSRHLVINGGHRVFGIYSNALQTVWRLQIDAVTAVGAGFSLAHTHTRAKYRTAHWKWVYRGVNMLRLCVYVYNEVYRTSFGSVKQ